MAEKTEEKEFDVSGLDIGKLEVDAPVGEDEQKEEETQNESAAGADDTSDEENKVSYSRFKNVHSRWRESERKAQELEERLQELESTRAERIEREAPSYEGKKWTTWVKLYGDTPQSREAYQDFMSEFAPPDESYIQQVAAQAYLNEARNEERRVAQN